MTTQNKPEVGKLYEGKVKKMLNFGAFVEILPGVEGLVHISQMAPVRIAQPEDVLEIGAIIDVKCIEFTEDTLRLTMLDVEQLNEKVANRIMRAEIKGDAKEPKREDRDDRRPRSFGDKPRRSFGDKPRGDRNSRPARDGDRPKHNFSDKPRSDRPKRDFGYKKRSFGNKPNKPRTSK